MLGDFITRGLILVLGYAYPAFECFKTMEKNRVQIEEIRFWCQYWILVALLTVLERIGDTFISWLPMYGEVKLALFIYLWYPKTKGSGYVYETFLRPFVSEREPEIGRNSRELRLRVWDLAIYCWLNYTVPGQSILFNVLHYLASQSGRFNKTKDEKKKKKKKKEALLESPSIPLDHSILSETFSHPGDSIKSLASEVDSWSPLEALLESPSIPLDHSILSETFSHPGDSVISLTSEAGSRLPEEALLESPSTPLDHLILSERVIFHPVLSERFSHPALKLPLCLPELHVLGWPPKPFPGDLWPTFRYLQNISSTDCTELVLLDLICKSKHLVFLETISLSQTPIKKQLESLFILPNSSSLILTSGDSLEKLPEDTELSASITKGASETTKLNSSQVMMHKEHKCATVCFEIYDFSSLAPFFKSNWTATAEYLKIRVESPQYILEWMVPDKSASLKYMESYHCSFPDSSTRDGAWCRGGKAAAVIKAAVDVQVTEVNRGCSLRAVSFCYIEARAWPLLLSLASFLKFDSVKTCKTRKFY